MRLLPLALAAAAAVLFGPAAHAGYVEVDVPVANCTVGVWYYDVTVTKSIPPQVSHSGVNGGWTNCP